MELFVLLKVLSDVLSEVRQRKSEQEIANAVQEKLLLRESAVPIAHVTEELRVVLLHEPLALGVLNVVVAHAVLKLVNSIDCLFSKDLILVLELEFKLLIKIGVALLENGLKCSEDGSFLNYLVLLFFSVDALALEWAAFALRNFAGIY